MIINNNEYNEHVIREETKKSFIKESDPTEKITINEE